VRLVGGTAILTDLGVMHGVVSGQRDDATESGVALDTPADMSPEFLAGDSESGHLSDIYSVACLLIHMIVGHPPHHAPTSRALLARRLRGPLRRWATRARACQKRWTRSCSTRSPGAPPTGCRMRTSCGSGCGRFAMETLTRKF